MSVCKIMYNVVTTLAPSLLIGSSSSLYVTWIAIKSWIGLNWLGAEEFAAFECLEKSHILIMGEIL